LAGWRTTTGTVPPVTPGSSVATAVGGSGGFWRGARFGSAGRRASWGQPSGRCLWEALASQLP
jgi:hypothetical protein